MNHLSYGPCLLAATTFNERVQAGQVASRDINNYYGLSEKDRQVLQKRLPLTSQQVIGLEHLLKSDLNLILSKEKATQLQILQLRSEIANGKISLIERDGYIFQIEQLKVKLSQATSELANYHNCQKLTEMA